MIFELEFAAGLEAIVQTEIQQKLGVTADSPSQPGYLRLKYPHKPNDFLQLRTVNSVYQSLYFDVPRPKALLGHQHFTRLVNNIMPILEQSPTDYQTLFVSAAGSESSVMQRLKQALAEQLDSQIGDTSGDLWLRIKRHKAGWEVLIRITPRPLATRSWRVCDYEGALNAPVAYAMGSMVSAGEVVVNLLCGSGTLMVEYPHAHQRLIGIDTSPDALACARNNLNAAQIHVELLEEDATRTTLADKSVDVLLADLPFGQLVGSHADNQLLYPAILSEAARIAKPDAQFVLITHEIRLIEDSLRKSAEWRVESVQRVSLRGYHPRIFLLRKS